MLKNMKTMAFVVVAMLLFAVGCDTSASSSAPAAPPPNPTHFSSSTFFVAEEWTEEIDYSVLGNYVLIYYKIVVDTATGVMYLHTTSQSEDWAGKGVGLGLSSTFSVLLNADGTPRIYDGSIPTQ